MTLVVRARRPSPAHTLSLEDHILEVIGGGQLTDEEIHASLEREGRDCGLEGVNRAIATLVAARRLSAVRPDMKYKRL